MFEADADETPTECCRLRALQCWFNLSDESAEEAIYDSLAVRDFVGIDLGRRHAPDVTTLLQFRHLLEAYRLTERLMAELNALLSVRGLMMRAGTIADATLIAVSPSARNQQRARDPEMHQTRTGNQWAAAGFVDTDLSFSSGISHLNKVSLKPAAAQLYVQADDRSYDAICSLFMSELCGAPDRGASEVARSRVELAEARCGLALLSADRACAADLHRVHAQVVSGCTRAGSICAWRLFAKCEF